MGRFSLNREQATALARTVKIVHPYGTVGSLWPNETEFVDYGWQNGDFPTLASRIQTYTEKLAEGAQLDAMKDMVRKANVIVFLGFAFHPQNMKLLEATRAIHPKQIYATAMGCSAADITEFKKRVISIFPDAPDTTAVVESSEFLTAECKQFLSQYAATLSA